MIQQITAFSPEETAILEQSWRGRQMLAYQQAYGGGYDFCRFFRATDCGGTGWLFLFNATLLICAEGSVPEEEIRNHTKTSKQVSPQRSIHLFKIQPRRLEYSQIF